MENIKTLYSTTNNREIAKSEDKKTNPGFSKSKSDERVDSQEAESREHVLTGRSASSASLDNGTSSVPSKYTSREAVVKSQKPTTKPLHLGKLYSKSRRRESYFASYYGNYSALVSLLAGSEETSVKSFLHSFGMFLSTKFTSTTAHLQ